MIREYYGRVPVDLHKYRSGAKADFAASIESALGRGERMRFEEFFRSSPSILVRYETEEGYLYMDSLLSIGEDVSLMVGYLLGRGCARVSI